MRRTYFSIVFFCGFIVASCESDSPVEPSSSAASFSRMVDASSAVTASAVSPYEIDLAWQRASSQVTGFQVFRSTTGPTGNYSLLTTTAGSASRYANVGLTASTQYCYEVRSFKTAGKNTNYSAFSSAVCASTLPPPAPTIIAPSDVNVVAVPNAYYIDFDGSNVLVTWKDNSPNEDGFRVERASTIAGPWTIAANNWANYTSTFEYAPREKQICFRVIAYTAADSSAPTPADCTIPPANPTGLVADGADGQSIALTWTDNSAAEDGYKVSRLEAGTWTALATVVANTVSYRDAAAAADQTYSYRVQAMRDGGLSDYSNESVAVISTRPPAAPTNASASYWVDNEYGWLYFDFAWANTSNNEEGFRIDSSEDGVNGWQTYATFGPGTTIFEQAFSLWDSLWPHSGCYRIVAFNHVGDSPASNVTCTGWFTPPTNLVAAAVDQQSIDLTWTDNARFENGYVVFRASSVDGPYDIVGQTAANVTSYHDTGLTSGQEYWYSVATDFGGYSIYDGFESSDYASATTVSSSASPMLSIKSSRTAINRRPSSLRVVGAPTPAEIRARHKSSSVRLPGTKGSSPRRTK
jgi:hypothetical protein